jgi:hypothetical protein
MMNAGPLDGKGGIWYSFRARKGTDSLVSHISNFTPYSSGASLMVTPAATQAVAYPSFAEFLVERYDPSAIPSIAPRDDARVLGVQEETVVGWISGTAPGTRIRSKIAEHYDYDFRQRRFVEAAAEAAFPPDGATASLRSIQTMDDFERYIRMVLGLISAAAINRQLGWPRAAFTRLMTADEFRPKQERLVDLLRFLPTLDQHLRGKVLSACTPRSVIGHYLHECRLRRGEKRVPYVKRIGVGSQVCGLLEGERGHYKASQRAYTFYRDYDALERICAFLEQERKELQVEPPAGMAEMLDAFPIDAHQQEERATGEETPDKAAAPVPGALSGDEDEVTLLRQRIAEYVSSGITITELAREAVLPVNTLRRVSRSDSRPQKSTVKRIIRSLDELDVAEGSRRPDSHDEAEVSTVVTNASASVAKEDTAPTMRELEGRIRSLEALTDRVARLEARFREEGDYVSSVNVSSPSLDPSVLENFREHDADINASYVKLVSERARSLGAMLTRLAGVRNEERRAQIRASLLPEVDELFSCIELFQSEHPGGAFELMKRQREFVHRHRKDPKGKGAPT